MNLESKMLLLLGRENPLFGEDLACWEDELAGRIRGRSFLVVGGAGSIGQAVCKELFRRQPKRLHVADLSENNLVELVRDLRSSLGYIDGDFRSVALDFGGPEFGAFLRHHGPYDHVLNLAAMKHVRSERDPYTLMRMVRTNVLDNVGLIEASIAAGCGQLFAVSSDKAANPASAMGASKRLMELSLIRASERIQVTSARFANVVFSDGSLPWGFSQRLAKGQPLAAPADVQRYFITASEAAVLCLFGALLGENREAVFPQPREGFAPLSFHTLAERFLRSRGLEPHLCASEEEARARVDELAARGSWPCFFSGSETTGEKKIEEFVMAHETVDTQRFREVGIIRWSAVAAETTDRCIAALEALISRDNWSRDEILLELKAAVPELVHLETGKFLDSRM